MTFRRRSIALLVGLAAMGINHSMPQMPLSAHPGASRRTKTPRRALSGRTHVLPGRKGVAQKRQGKQCTHHKQARNRRRSARLARR